MSPGDVVQLNTHVLDVERFAGEAADVLERELTAVDVDPPGVLSQFAGLGHPGLLVELDALAVR